MKIQHTRMTFQANVLLLFLICAVVPLILNTSLNIVLYSVRLSDDNRQKYDNVLSSLGNNIESHLSELERLTLSPYQYDDMTKLYTYAQKKGSPDYSLSTWNQLVIQYEAVSTRLTALTSPSILGFVYIPLSEDSDTCYVYQRKLCRINECVSSDVSIDRWLPTLPYSYKYTTYCPPHTVSYYQKQEELSVISLIKPIHDFDSRQTTGILKVDSSIDFFEELFAELTLSDATSITLATKDGEFIYSTNPSEGKKVLDAYQKNRSQAGIVCNYTLAKSGWQLLYSVSYWEFYKPIINALGVSLLLSLGLFLISVWNYRRISAQFTKPLQNILSTMHKAKQGNLLARADTSLPMNHEFEQITIQLNHMIESLDEHIKKEYMAVISKKNAQFQALQAQINPHFLYNTLNNFVALNRIGEKKLLEDSIIQLTRIFHYTCSNSAETTLEDEFTFLEHYLFLQKIRFEDRLSFSLSLDERTRSFKIPRLLIQPLVENSIVHGLEGSECLAKVEVNASLIHLPGIGDCIFLAVIDNGCGFDKKKLKLNNSVGLLNITERLQLFESESFFEIHSAIGGYTGNYIVIHLLDSNTLPKEGEY